MFLCLGPCVVVCAGKCCARKDTSIPTLLSAHSSTPCSPSSLIPSPCLHPSLPADRPLPFPFFFLPSFFCNPSCLSQLPCPLLPLLSFCQCLCLFTATSNGFRSIKGTQRSLLASLCCGRMKPCTQGSAALIIK